MIARGLLPVYHADRLAEGTLIVRWLCVLGVVLAASGATGVAIVAGVPGEERRVTEGITENRRLIVETDAGAAAARDRAATASRAIEARKAVGEHPDWGLLIERLAGAAGTSVAVEEVVITLGVVDSPKPATTDGKPVPKVVPKRRWVVAVSGLAPKQSTVAQVVAAVEAWGLFDRVKLVESKARTISRLDAVGFKIEGVIEEGRR
jgi:hypothetical protein